MPDGVKLTAVKLFDFKSRELKVCRGDIKQLYFLVDFKLKRYSKEHYDTRV